MKRTKRIDIILTKEFSDFIVNIIDNSFMHKGHGNFDGDGETHIIVELQKKRKSKFDRLTIHKRRYTLLKDEFETGLHSLEIKTTLIN